MANIKVHVLNFHGPFSHIEIVLENTSAEPHTYYGINRWETPQNSWNEWQGEYIRMANSKHAFNIEANPDNIVKTWGEYYYSTDNHASILGENCAVAAQKFLTHFANIPQPSSSNISWNHLAFGIMWPSFIPCPVTLPGRIMDNAKFHTQNPIFSCTSIEDLANDHENQYLRAAISSLKNEKSTLPPDSLDRLKTLTDFYDQLHNMSKQAEDLKKRGYNKEAECATNLVNALQDASRKYLTSPDDQKSFETFKDKCKERLNEDAPILEVHRGWKRILSNIALAVVGAGVIYLIAAGFNKATTGKFLFNSKTRSMKRIHDIRTSLRLTEEKHTARYLDALLDSNVDKSQQR